MIRYYLNDNCQEQSLCLEGITVYRQVTKNLVYNEKLLKLNKFLEKGLLNYQEIDSQARVIFDNFKPFEKVTILDSNFVDVVNKRKRKKDA